MLGEADTPRAHQSHRVGVGVLAVRDGDDGAVCVLVGLGRPDQDFEPVGGLGEVGQVQGNQFGSAAHERDPEHQGYPVTQPDGGRRVAVLDHGAQRVDRDRGGLPSSVPGAGPLPAVPAQHQPRALGVGLPPVPGGAVRGADGGDGLLDGGRGVTGVGEVRDVLGEGLGGRGQLGAAAGGAPGGERGPLPGVGADGVRGHGVDDPLLGLLGHEPVGVGRPGERAGSVQHCQFPAAGDHQPTPFSSR